MARKNREAQGQPGGQTVDVSIFERCACAEPPATDGLADLVHSMINLMEGIIPEYDRKGKVRNRSEPPPTTLAILPLAGSCTVARVLTTSRSRSGAPQARP